jgi:Ca2+/Na+ antiporter
MFNTSLILATSTVSDSDAAVGGIIILIACVIGAIAWITPGIIASCRKYHNKGAIWAITILLGWTFLGWVIAFVWAFTNPAPQQLTINNR